VTDALSVRHGAYPYFCSRLAEAFVVVDVVDLELVKAALIKAKKTTEVGWKQFLTQNYKEVASRCRRYAPAPDILKRRLDTLFQLFKDLPDAESGEKFFKSAALKEWASLMRYVQKGCLSDPDPREVDLYFIVGTDGGGVPIYGCYRGTNDLEGYHQKLKGIMAGWNISPEVR
jgi:hypothetical protein